MQYDTKGTMTDAAPEHTKTVLHTQAFGFVALPLSAEEKLARFARSHFHLCARRSPLKSPFGGKHKQNFHFFFLGRLAGKPVEISLGVEKWSTNHNSRKEMGHIRRV